jgi:hypothetical protein
MQIVGEKDIVSLLGFLYSQGQGPRQKPVTIQEMAKAMGRTETDIAGINDLCKTKGYTQEAQGGFVLSTKGAELLTTKFPDAIPKPKGK